MSKRKITTAEDLRGALLATIQGLIEGKVTVASANAVVGCSGELHKSLRQEWDMRCYANQNLSISAGEVVKLIDIEDVDDA